jgi:hypothetical protein
MKRAAFACVLLVVTVGSVSGCGDKGAKKSDESKVLAARVDQWTLTRDELGDLIASLPEAKKGQYDTPFGQAEMAENMILEEMFHQEGLKLKLPESDIAKKRIEYYIRQLIISEYYHKNVKPEAIPSEEELHDYYEANIDRYTTQPLVRAQHIFSKDREKLVDFKKRIDEGEKMTTLAHKYSEDVFTKNEGGDLGFFNPGGFIGGVGYSKEISDAVFSMPQGVVSDPVKWEKGYSLLRVNEKKESKVRLFEEVRDQIAKIFIDQNIEEVKKAKFQELKEKYMVRNFLEEELELTERTAEELWNLAQSTPDARQKVDHYEKIVKRFPDSEFAAQALFMIGFVYAEDLKNPVLAERYLHRVLVEYPESEVAKSAQWMLDNLGRPNPDFKELEQLRREVSGDSK